MNTVAQIVGVVLLAVAGLLLWSPWALVVAGGLLLVIPELVSVRARRGVS